MVRGEIHLQPPNNGGNAAADQNPDEELERHLLEKYTFSNALALSGCVPLHFIRKSHSTFLLKFDFFTT